MQPHEFRQLISQKAAPLYRTMPWREQPSFYYVLVSEVMLQQTQVPRVLPKFANFITLFPTIELLAEASLADVLRAWQGLGYNRRAQFLHQAAKYVALQGQPVTYEGLLALPGVGRATAAALMNYVYNVPTAFIETNIRTVYFYHFFADQTDISDTKLYELVQNTIDVSRPREWFWALMDYGTWLKAQGMGSITLSKHYKKQAPLKGSVREVRGQIIRSLASGPKQLEQLKKLVSTDERFTPAMQALQKEGLVVQHGSRFELTNEG